MPQVHTTSLSLSHLFFFPLLIFSELVSSDAPIEGYMFCSSRRWIYCWKLALCVRICVPSSRLRCATRMAFNMTHQQAQRATLEHCFSPSSAQKALKALLIDDMQAAWRTLRVVWRCIALMCSVCFFFLSFSRPFYQLSFHLSLTPAEGSQQVDTLANLLSFPLFFFCYSCIGVVLFIREVFLNRKRHTKCV